MTEKDSNSQGPDIAGSSQPACSVCGVGREGLDPIKLIANGKETISSWICPPCSKEHIKHMEALWNGE